MKTPRFTVRPCWYTPGGYTIRDTRPEHPRANTVEKFTGRPTILRRALKIAEEERAGLTEAIWLAEARQKEWSRKRWNRNRELHRRAQYDAYYA